MTQSKTPSISVLMPVHNGGEYLESACVSILRQTHAHFEFIIVNDASTDHTAQFIDELARQDARVRPIHLEQSGGISEALNTGLRAARGAYVARMDADDISANRRLAQQYAFLEANPGFACVGVQYSHIDGQGRIIKREWPPEEIYVDSDHAYPRAPHVVHPSSMFRRQVALDVGGYRRAMEPSEDIDLWLRLWEVSRIGNIRQSLFYYRQHDKQYSRQSIQTSALSHGLTLLMMRRRHVSVEPALGPETPRLASLGIDECVERLGLSAQERALLRGWTLMWILDRYSWDGVEVDGSLLADFCDAYCRMELLCWPDRRSHLKRHLRIAARRALKARNFRVAATAMLLFFSFKYASFVPVRKRILESHGYTQGFTELAIR